MKKKSKLLKCFIIFCFLGYLCLTGYLFYHASLDGNESASQSGAVGENLSGIVNDTKGDQTVLINPTDLIIENKIEDAKVGEKHQLECSTLPSDASYKSLSYESSDAKIASVSSTGLIKFLKEGTVEITVCNKDFPDIKKSIEINITKIDLESFTIKLMENKEEVTKIDEVYSLKQFETYTIKRTFDPKDASVTKVTYTYDKEYITISNNKIYAKKPVDELEIKAKCDGIVNTFKISIEEVIIEEIELIDFNLENNKIAMHVGESINISSNPFNVTFVPNNATNQTLTYTSNNTDIVEIENGEFLAKKPGVVTINITSQEKEITKEVTIEVSNVIILKDEPFEIEQEYLEYNNQDNTYHIRNGLGGKIECNFTDDSTYTQATFTSSNEKVLLVGNDGQITPVKIGKAKVIVTIDDTYLDPIVLEIDIVVEGKPFLENLSEFYYFVRKSIGHFGAFFVLGGLGAFAFLLTFDKRKWIFSVPLTTVLGFAIAGLTEYVQTFVPGRYGAWSDVFLDFAGYISATILVIIFLSIIYLSVYYKKKKILQKGE